MQLGIRTVKIFGRNSFFDICRELSQVEVDVTFLWDTPVPVAGAQKGGEGARVVQDHHLVTFEWIT